MPTLERELVTEKGENGWMGSWFAHENDDSMTPLPEPLKSELIDETRIFIRSAGKHCSMDLLGSFWIISKHRLSRWPHETLVIETERCIEAQAIRLRVRVWSSFVRSSKSKSTSHGPLVLQKTDYVIIQVVR